MRRILRFIISASLAVSASAISSCKEIQEEYDSAPVTFLANREQPGGTTEVKVYPDWASGNYVWEKMDTIALFSSGVPVAFENKSKSEGTSAEFSGKIGQSSRYVALYPYSADATLHDNIIRTQLPSVQKAGKNGNDPKSFLSVAISKDNNLSFKNVFSILKFTLEDNDITSVTLFGSGNEYLAGTIDIAIEDNTPSYELIDGAQSITLLPEGPAFTPGTYSIALLPQTLEEGLRLVFRHSGSVKTVAKKTSDGTVIGFERNCVVDAKAFNFENDNYRFYYITNTDEFADWYADSANWSESDLVYLGNDIDCSGLDLTPTGATFSGLFNGFGHSINNLNIEYAGNACLLPYVTGTVKNVNFGSRGQDESTSFKNTSTNGESYTAPLGQVKNGGKISNITSYASIELKGAGGRYTGGICAYYSSPSPVTDCRFFGEISITGNVAEAIDAGGIFGCVSTTDEIKDCENNGTLAVSKLPASEKQLNIGGIAGLVTNPATLSDCTNNGNIEILESVSGGRRTNLGGIVGMWYNAGGLLTLCNNYGNISNRAASFSGKQQFLGGITGRLAGDVNGPKIEASCNYGNILNETEATYNYLGGIVGYSTVVATIGSESGPCINYGQIRNTGPSSNSSINGQPNIAVAGIIGGILTKPCTVECCSNLNFVFNYSQLAFGGPDGINKTTVGGIVAFSATESIIRDCCNSAPVYSCNDSTGTKMSRSYTGGILGYSYRKALGSFSGNTNEAEVKSDGLHVFDDYVGGLIGFVDAVATDLSSCSNNADVINLATRTESDVLSDGTKATAVCIGGIVGHHSGSGTLYDCINTGTIINTASEYHSGSNMGGIAGQMSSNGKIKTCSNQGNVLHTAEPTTASLYYSLGGIVGLSSGAIAISDNCTNSGRIEKSAVTSVKNNHYIGGILGRNNAEGTSISDCSNIGDGSTGKGCTISSSPTNNVYMGGILGHTNKTVSISRCTNSGAVKLTGNASAAAYIGGIAGSYANGSAGSTLASCSNRGEVSMLAKAGTSARIGGVIADAYGKHSITDCGNSAAITNNSASVKDVRLAGILASNTNNSTSIIGCTNTGKLLSNTSGTLAVGYFAGILGYKSEVKNTIDACENLADVEVSATKIEKIFIGGINAYNNADGSSITNCKVLCSLITKTTPTTKYIGMIGGYMYSPIINTTGFAGKFDNTTVNMSNWNKISTIVGGFKTTSDGINVSSDASSCYFISSNPAFGADDLIKDEDDKNW